MVTTHRSKVDRWFVVVMTIAIIGSLVAAIAVASTGTMMVLALAGFIVLVCAALPIWLLLSTRYTLSEDQLVVQCGPFKWRIPLAEIIEITPTSNPLSSPALSLDRLRIEYGEGSSLMISPCKKQQFIDDIKAARGVAAKM